MWSNRRAQSMRPVHVFANFHCFFDSVDHHAVFFVDVGDGNAVQCAVVRRLAAALGVEGGAVQRHQKPVFPRLTGQDRGGECLSERGRRSRVFPFPWGTFLSFTEMDCNEPPDGLDGKGARYGGEEIGQKAVGGSPGPGLTGQQQGVGRRFHQQNHQLCRENRQGGPAGEAVAAKRCGRSRWQDPPGSPDSPAKTPASSAFVSRSRRAPAKGPR